MSKFIFSLGLVSIGWNLYYLINYNFKILPLMCGFGVIIGIADVWIGIKDWISGKK